MRKVKFSAEECKKLSDLIAEGADFETMVDAFPNRAPRAIRDWARKNRNHYWPKRLRPNEWRPDEDAVLTEIMKGGASYGEAGAKMGRSKNGIEARCRKLGLRPLKSDRPTFWTEEVVGELKRMVIDGYSSYHIGMELGFSRNAVLGKIHRLNLSINSSTGSAYAKLRIKRKPPKRRQPSKKRTAPSYWTDARISLLKQYVDQGLNSFEIAKKFNNEKSPAAIRSRILKRLNVTQKPGRPAKPRLRAKTPHPFFMPRVPFAEATKHQCGYPLWGEDKVTGDVCGCSKEAGKPYCDHHMRRAYVPGSNRRKRNWSDSTKENATASGLDLRKSADRRQAWGRL